MNERRPLQTFRLAVLAVLAMACFLLLIGPAPALQAGSLSVVQLTASPSKVAAEGGSALIVVSAADIRLGGAITLSTTRGAFGSVSGPTRVVLPLEPDADGEATASTNLVGAGLPGPARVTARSGASERSVIVTFYGEPSSVTFDAPSADGSLSARSTHSVIVQVRDRMETTVPDTAVTLSTDAGILIGAGQRAAFVTVVSDVTGRARARLDAPPGPMRITARAGSVSAERDVALYGAPAALELLSLRSSINLGDTPFPSPDGSLIAFVHDEGGRPVPGVEVTFQADTLGVDVLPDDGLAEGTDASGRVSGRVSAAEAVEAGLVIVTAEAAGLSDQVVLRIVGSPARIFLWITDLGGDVLTVQATVQDASGFAVPTGFEMDWEAVNVGDEGTVTFDPPRSLVRSGTAETTVVATDVERESVTIRGLLVGMDPPLTVAAMLPAPLPKTGTALVAGLNSLIWEGDTGTIAGIVEPIARLVIAAWRLDLGAGWQGYFPTAGMGENYFIASGDVVYLFIAAPVLLPDVVRTLSMK
jgi:hypothetical protein